MVRFVGRDGDVRRGDGVNPAYVVYGADGTHVGEIVSAVGVPAFGANAPALLLRR